MKISNFIKLCREKFLARINRKTGWGKNELMQEYDMACGEALSEMILSEVSTVPDTLHYKEECKAKIRSS